jgi:hypothetical protein
MFSLDFLSSSHLKLSPESSLPVFLLIPKYPLRPYECPLVDSPMAISPAGFKASSLALQKAQSTSIRTQCHGHHGHHDHHDHHDHPVSGQPRNPPIYLPCQRSIPPKCTSAHAHAVRTRSIRTKCTRERGAAGPPSLMTLTCLSSSPYKNNAISSTPLGRTSATRGTALMRLRLSRFGPCSVSPCLGLNALPTSIYISSGH